MFISPSTKSRKTMCVQSSIVSTGWNAELYDEPRIVARITTPDRKVALVAPSTRSLSLTSSKRTYKLIKWYQTNSHLENRLERWNYAGVTPQAPTDCSQTTTHLLSRGCLIAISWGFHFFFHFDAFKSGDSRTHAQWILTVQLHNRELYTRRCRSDYIVGW